MYFLTRVTFGACLVPCITAFYPYVESGLAETATPSEPSSLEQRGVEQDSVLRMSIKRTPVKRDNRYNIIGAALPARTSSLGVDQDGTDFSYFSTFTFGTSKKSYHMLLDSGAGSTWVYGTGCTSDACKAHNALGTAESTSLNVSSTPFAITYGTGSVSGVLATDTLRFSSFNVPLTFGLTSNASSEFISYPMDGILGLGRADVSTSFNTMSSPTIMDVLSSQGLIQHKLYGISLWRNSDGSANNGEINFGVPDTSRYDGALSYAAAVTNTNGYWEIPLGDATVNGKALGLKGRTAIMDTGTSFLVIPPSDAAQLHSLIAGSAQNGERFTLPCSSTQTVQLTFGGTAYSISSKDYVGKSTGSGGMCASNIVGRQTFGSTQWLVGDVFFKNVYTIFDYDGQRVGFGVKGGTQATTSAITTTSPSVIASSSSTTAVTTSAVVSVQHVVATSFTGSASSTASGMTSSPSTSLLLVSSSSLSTSPSTASSITSTSDVPLVIAPITSTSATTAMDGTTITDSGLAITPVTTETPTANTASPESPGTIASAASNSADISTPASDSSSGSASAIAPSGTEASSNSTATAASPASADTAGGDSTTPTANNSSNAATSGTNASSAPASTDSANAAADNSNSTGAASNSDTPSSDSSASSSESSASPSNNTDTSTAGPATAADSKHVTDPSSSGNATDTATTAAAPSAASAASGPSPPTATPTFAGTAAAIAPTSPLLSLSVAVFVAALSL